MDGVRCMVLYIVPIEIFENSPSTIYKINCKRCDVDTKGSCVLYGAFGIQLVVQGPLSVFGSVEYKHDTQQIHLSHFSNKVNCVSCTFSCTLVFEHFTFYNLTVSIIYLSTHTEQQIPNLPIYRILHSK